MGGVAQLDRCTMTLPKKNTKLQKLQTKYAAYPKASIYVQLLEERDPLVHRGGGIMLSLAHASCLQPVSLTSTFGQAAYILQELCLRDEHILS